MGFLSRLKWALFPQKAKILTTSVYQNLNWYTYDDKTWDAKKASEEGYSKNVIVYHCVSQRAKAFSTIPYCLYSIQKNGKKVEIENHPAIDLFENPNPIWPKASFLETINGFYALTGNTYWENVLGGKFPLQVWPRSPLEMFLLIPRLADMPVAYVRRHFGNEKRFDVDPLTGDCLISHWKNFNPNDPFQGLSPLSAAALDVMGMNNAANWNSNLMANRGRPEGILKLRSSDLNLGGALTEIQRSEIRKILNSESEDQGVGRVFILPQDMDYQQLGLSPLEMDYIQSRKTSKTDIALALGYPPYMLGLEGVHSTFNNMEQAKAYFYETTILPDAQAFIRKYNQDIVAYFGDNLRFEPDYDSIDALETTKTAIYSVLENLSFLTINEKRAYGNQDPLPGGDDLLVPSTVMPLGELLAAPIPTDLPVDPTQKEFKAINLKSDLAKKNYAISFQTRKLGHERRFRFHIKQYFKAENEMVLMGLEKINLKDDSAIHNLIELIQAENESELLKILTSNYLAIMRDFAGDVLNAFKESRPEIETKDAPDLFLDFSKRFLKENLNTRLTYIQKGQNQRLNQYIQEGMAQITQQDENLDAPTLQNIIRPSIMEDSTGYLSERIARTETTIAAHAGSFGAANEIQMVYRDQVTMFKTWVAVNDKRTRDSHANMDGKELPLSETFPIGPEGMDGPGDPSGPVEEVINCRCVLTYNTGD